MDAALQDLPNDVDALRAIVLAQRVELQKAQGQVDRLTAQSSRYEHIIDQLRRMQFGKRSEKLDKDQLALAFEDLHQALAEIESHDERKDAQTKQDRTRQRRESRPSLPPHLPEVEIVIDPMTTACPCCAGSMHLIGEDVSRRLDVVPAQ